MSNREVGCLDRFVNARAPVLAGVIDDSRRILGMGIAAGVYGVMGLGSLIGALAAAISARHGAAVVPLVFQGAVFLMGSGVFAGARAWIKRCVKVEHTTQVRLTPEAKKLVRTLITHLEGWPGGRRRRRRRLRRAMKRGLLRALHDRRCEDVLSPEAFRLLESAAREYNRIYGTLAADNQGRNPTLEKLGPNIYAATDEAMAEILHAAALVDRFPESGARWESQTSGRVEELRELADQVERLQNAAPAPAALGSGASRLQDVLGELRAVEQACEELRFTASPTEERRLYRR
jgi:hypothetical protein